MLGVFDHKKAAEILGVPYGVSVVELMPLGYPAETPKGSSRKEFKEFVYFERYGSRLPIKFCENVIN